MDTGKSTNKHPVDISKLSVDEMDAEIKKGFHDMLEERITPAKEVFVNMRKDYGLEDYHAKKEKRGNNNPF